MQLRRYLRDTELAKS
ncbi:hypothetical protein VCR8J2_190703 [Vibrio coralliirubri]|nr:hypothetical protein VCR8J2_190703 [Vibrio coralliirubri]